MENGRVLFVDDTFRPHIWKATNIDICADPTKVESLLESNQYTMVSLDYDMPYLTGLDLLRDIDWNKYKIPFINIHSFHPNARDMITYIQNNFTYRCIIFSITKQTLSDDSEICKMLTLASKKYAEELDRWNNGEFAGKEYIELAKENLIYRVRKHYSEKINIRNGIPKLVNIKDGSALVLRLIDDGYEVTYNPFGNLSFHIAELRHNIFSNPTTIIE